MRLVSVRDRLPRVPVSVVRLSDLSAGAVANFHDARLDEDTCSLLRALGLTARCTLRLSKLGDPCIVQVRGTRSGDAQPD